MQEFNIKDFDTIQTAVNACSEAGGGTVIVPEGEWKSGAIHLKSNVNVHLEDGAVIVFSDRYEDYLPVVFTRWEGTECYNYSPLIYANNCENISVTGRGTLIGNGQSWWHWKKLQQAAAEELCYSELNGVPPEKRIYGTETAALRPSFIQTINCKNVLLEDFTIKDGPQWTIHPVYCENVTVRKVHVSTHGPNTDGLNPDSCRNVLIENCIFETGDDCIAINSGLNEDGWRADRPCENIEIRNCVMNGGHGAVVIGSAMSGGVRNVYAHDCKISGTMQGIRLKSMRGRGGYVDNVKFEDMEINDVTEQAIQINMFYEFSTVMPKTDTPSDFRNIEIRNIRGKGAKTGIQIKGLPEHKLKNITLENIDLAAENAIEFSDAENIKMNDVKIDNNKMEGQ
ncbi:MAG: glycoside hydrolase family 28 protein [Candidatus Ornithomonoglobus sp.]